MLELELDVFEADVLDLSARKAKLTREVFFEVIIYCRVTSEHLMTWRRHCIFHFGCQYPETGLLTSFLKGHDSF